MSRPALLRFIWIILAGAVGVLPVAWTVAAPGAEEAIAANPLSATFETVTIGGHTLRRATVFERTEEMVYLKHDGGLLGTRVAELDGNTRRLLGYDVPADPVVGEGSLRLRRTSMEAQAEGMATRLGGWAGWGSDMEEGWGAGLGLLVMGVIVIVGLGVHLFLSGLLRMICRKADSVPGFMIWLPVLQVFPLLKAAGMSRRWPFAIFILSLLGAFLAGFSLELALLISLCSSLLGLGLGIAWSIKICLARGKSPIWAVFLLLPGLNLVGLVYLAASE
jgi:hypothetical protein